VAGRRMAVEGRVREACFCLEPDSYCVYNDSLNTVGILKPSDKPDGMPSARRTFVTWFIYIFECHEPVDPDLRQCHFGVYADISCGGSDKVQDYGHRRMVFDSR